MYIFSSLYFTFLRHAAEEDALRNQIENQNELLHAFEKSIHQKDVVITNLTNTLQKQVCFISLIHVTTFSTFCLLRLAKLLSFSLPTWKHLF